MKKLIAVLFAGVCAVSAFAAPKFPGWKSTDIAALDAAAAEYKAAKQYQQAVNCIVLKDLNTGKIANFEALCAKIDEVAKSVEFAGSSLCKRQIPLCTRMFLPEAWQYCQKNPRPGYDINYVLSVNKQLNLSDEQICTYLYNYCINLERANASTVDRAVDLFIKKSIGVDEAKAKDMLRKMNRKFSPMLIKDKATWEPIIAKIRTAIDAF